MTSSNCIDKTPENNLQVSLQTFSLISPLASRLALVRDLCFKTQDKHSNHLEILELGWASKLTVWEIV